MAGRTGTTEAVFLAPPACQCKKYCTPKTGRGIMMTGSGRAWTAGGVTY